MDDAAGEEILRAAAAGADPASVLQGRSEAFLSWARHHPRLGVIVHDLWTDLHAGGACAKPGEVARALLREVATEGLWTEAEERAS